jgi:predicted transcriptional regulator
MGAEMKTATIPSLRVDPELRRSAESVLQEGESLSGFVEQAIRQSVAHRQAEQEFIVRGLKARDQARQTGHYVEASAVVERLQGMLDKAKSGQSPA